MKQSDDPKAFFEKFRFTLTMTQKSKEFPEETITFEGHEARYVSELERDNAELKKHITELRERLWFWQEREYRKPLEKLLKDSAQGGE